MNAMFNNIQNAIVVKRGKCIYGDSNEYEIRIIRWHILYGTGDYEDPIDIRDDRNVECYYVFFEDLVNKGEFNAGGEGFLTVEEAVLSIGSKYSVKWLDSPA